MNRDDEGSMVIWEGPKYLCEKHGEHSHTIQSNIPGHKGTWCMMCALELLGPQMKAVEQEQPR